MPAQYVLARAERSRGRRTEALEAVRAGLRKGGGHVRLRMLESDLLAELGKAEDAVRAADALPEGPWKERQRLEQNLARLSPEEADAELEILAAMEPNRAEVHERLAMRRYKGRRFTEAAESFLRALELDPDNSYFRGMAGFASSKAGDAATAARLLRPLFVDNPLEEHVRTTFVSACRRTGDVADLRAAIDEALARHPHAWMLHGIRKRYAPEPPADVWADPAADEEFAA